ncbi:MAG: hypothetical protein Q7U33_11660 [Methylotenera sp.]|jgi:uncharacterized membrane protein YhaH (DUF805 family)|uniref:hypothetical protein n=1 Tax=Methylotenera sp. TaxID=2051956 RepID=UPI002726052B|nr:hypothetical protein [Methylotenera sp.]MDO9152024.1 hypothetical protein [Methylotenera sp.]
MLKGLNKKLLWIVVVWFAILQAFTPFIHAHVQADTYADGHGLHMHDAGLFEFQDNVHTLKNISDIETIGVNKALVKNMEALPVPLFLMLFIIPLLILSVRRYRYERTAHVSIPLFLKSLAGPRAPPLF